MASNHPFVDLLRASSELARESERLQTRARETISQSAAIMDQSRELLSMWPVSGIPTLARVHSSLGPLATPNPHPTAAPAELERVAEQNLSNQTVSLDGRHFVDCMIENCVLHYCGGPVVLEGTHFSGCRFQFADEAAMTVSLLECFGLMEEQPSQTSKSNSPRASKTRVN